LPLQHQLIKNGAYESEANKVENDVKREIALQTSKKKTFKDVEEPQKKALEDDPIVFNYNGVYDKMKEKVARPLIQDCEERRSKYIQNLIKKEKEWEQYCHILELPLT
ncbi:hypothetical protein S245_044413, partial [Arachis hypogaea]